MLSDTWTCESYLVVESFIHHLPPTKSSQAKMIRPQREETVRTGSKRAQKSSNELRESEFIVRFRDGPFFHTIEQTNTTTETNNTATQQMPTNELNNNHNGSKLLFVKRFDGSCESFISFNVRIIHDDAVAELRIQQRERKCTPTQKVPHYSWKTILFQDDEGTTRQSLATSNMMARLELLRRLNLESFALYAVRENLTLSKISSV